MVLGAVLAFFRRDLEAQYFLYRLRRDPAFFDEALLAPRESGKWFALRTHLKSAEGRTAFLERFIAEFLVSQGHQTPNSEDMPPSYYLRTRDINALRLGTIGLRSEPDLFWWDFRWGRDDKLWGLCTATTPALRAAPELLGELIDHYVVIPKYQGLRFKVVGLEDCPILQGEKRGLVSNPSSVFYGARQHVCMIERSR